MDPHSNLSIFLFCFHVRFVHYHHFDFWFQEVGTRHAKYTFEMSINVLLKTLVMKNQVFLSWNIFTQVCLFFPLKGECMRCMFWNNLGCIHFAMGSTTWVFFTLKKLFKKMTTYAPSLVTAVSNGQGKRNEDLLRARSYSRICDRPYFSVW